MLINSILVKFISVNEQKQEGRIEDPFGIEWDIPLDFLEIA